MGGILIHWYHICSSAPPLNPHHQMKRNSFVFERGVSRRHHILTLTSVKKQKLNTLFDLSKFPSQVIYITQPPLSSL